MQFMMHDNHEMEYSLVPNNRTGLNNSTGLHFVRKSIIVQG